MLNPILVCTICRCSLKLQGIGPDILGDINDKVLSGIGISTGDIIHIKKGSTIWWNGPNAK
jgi:hypothetical protein